MASTGREFTICLSDEGIAYSFGLNSSGQLGLGHNESVPCPTPIEIKIPIIQVSCGAEFAICLDEKGALWAFGNNNNKQLGFSENEMQANETPRQIQDIPQMRLIACGADHTLCLTDNNNLWAFGKNNYGQLCLETKTENSLPQQTKFSDISHICAGGYFSLFQNKEGLIYGCGSNSNGELGLGHEASSQVEVCLIPSPPNILTFCCGYSHVLYLDEEGNVFSVGYNSLGSLGLGSGDCNHAKQCTQIPDIPPIRYISCVGHTSYLIDFDGNFWSFGCNTDGQTGNTGRVIWSPEITCLQHITQIAKGCCGFHCVVKDSQDTIYGMGKNEYGELVKNEQKKFIVPTKICISQDVMIWGNSYQPFTNRAKSARK